MDNQNEEKEYTQFIEVKDCAKILNVHPLTIKRAIHAGKLRAVKVGQKRFRITEDDFRKYLNGLSYSVTFPLVNLPKEKIVRAIVEMDNKLGVND